MKVFYIIFMEQMVLQRLGKFHKPIKTKQLAGRLGVDLLSLTVCLNNLAKENQVVYINATTRQENKVCGWIKNPSTS